MVEVHHAKSLSMSFCLDCHRKPENALRPMGEVTNLSWTAAPSSANPLDTDREEEVSGKNPEQMNAKLIGDNLKNKWHVNAGVSCTTCHR